MATTTHDDYLVCKEYHEQISKKSADPAFITFQHENGNHYFAWVNGDDIIMRSEAYPDAEKMERGINAVKKNWDLTERYSTEDEHGAHFLVLWGGGDHQQHTGNMEGHSEIGRSCPKKSSAELHALLAATKGKDFADKIIKLETTATHTETTPQQEKPTATTEDVAKVAATATTVAAGATAAANTAKETVSNTTAKVTETATAYANSNTETSGGGGMGWLKWLLPLLALGAAILFWKNCNKSNTGEETTTITTDETTNVDANRGTVVVNADSANAGVAAVVTDTNNATTQAIESVRVKMANGIELSANKGGVEDKLVAFLNDKTAKFDAEDKTANWYDFDNLNFDLGKSTITKESMVQIDNLAAILKAYPALKIKVGGYTDKKGDDAGNKKLSQSRADAVVAALKNKGADAKQITGAEGYGEELAKVDENASDEARRADRRTAVRVMAR